MIMDVEPNKVKYPLGAVASIAALTFGEPGLRTFGLDARSGAASCSVWMRRNNSFNWASIYKIWWTAFPRRSGTKKATPGRTVGPEAT